MSDEKQTPSGKVEDTHEPTLVARARAAASRTILRASPPSRYVGPREDWPTQEEDTDAMGLAFDQLERFMHAHRMGQATPDEQEAEELVKHATAMNEAANYALSKFGDEYEGRLGPLREAVDAYEKWLVTETPGRRGRTAEALPTKDKP